MVKNNYVYIDRYGYSRVVEAADRDEALRLAENLSAEASLSYAAGSIAGILGEPGLTEDDLYNHDRAIARSLSREDY